MKEQGVCPAKGNRKGNRAGEGSRAQDSWELAVESGSV